MLQAAKRSKGMTQITVLVEGHYETHESPFGRSYEGYPAYATLECDCGQKLTLTGTGTIPTCRCGVDHSAIIQDIREREGRLPDKAINPWLYDTQERAEQNLRDEASYPSYSSRRYSDITSDYYVGQ